MKSLTIDEVKLGQEAYLHFDKEESEDHDVAMVVMNDDCGYRYVKAGWVKCKVIGVFEMNEYVSWPEGPFESGGILVEITDASCNEEAEPTDDPFAMLVDEVFVDEGGEG